MTGIMELASGGLIVIEDCAQSHGARIDGRPAGSFGHAAAFSFCQDKIITTGGEGGAVIFKDEAAFERAWSFKDHGKNRRKVNAPAAAPGFRWLHDSVGTNWRLTGPQAAIGLRRSKTCRRRGHAPQCRKSGQRRFEPPGVRAAAGGRFRHDIPANLLRRASRSARRDSGRAGETGFVCLPDPAPSLSRDAFAIYRGRTCEPSRMTGSSLRSINPTLRRALRLRAEERRTRRRG